MTADIWLCQYCWLRHDHYDDVLWERQSALRKAGIQPIGDLAHDPHRPFHPIGDPCPRAWAELLTLE